MNSANPPSRPESPAGYGNRLGHALKWLLLLVGATALAQALVDVTLEIQPLGRTVGVGDQVTITSRGSVSAEGFTWYKDGQFYQSGQGRFANLAWRAELTNAGSYWVVFTNITSSVTSQVAVLQVLAPGTVAFTQEPQSLRVREDEVAQLFGTASAPGTSVTYRWLRFGTNLPGAISQVLSLPLTNPNRVGDFQLVATALSSGNSVTSRVATVSIRPGLPPVVSMPLATVQSSLGARTNLSAVITEGDIPISHVWYRGTNLVSSLSGQPLQLPATLNYTINSVSSDTAGEYRVVASNAYGTTTSSVVNVTFVSPRTTILTNLTTSPARFAQYNTAYLTNQLAYFDRFSSAEVPHTLLLQPTFATAPFPVAAPWHLHLSASNLFHAVPASGGAPATGTWGYVPGASGFAGLFLTNYPVAGAVTRLEVFNDGTYGALSSARVNGVDQSGSESGSVLVFGAERPAVAEFSITLRSTNNAAFTWYHDNSPISAFGSLGRYTVSSTRLQPIQAGITNLQLRLVISNLTSADFGQYRLEIQNLGNGAVGDIQSSDVVPLQLLGPTATNAPGVVAAQEIRSNGNDDLMALAFGSDGGYFLASQSTTFGGGGSTTSRVVAYDRNGRTNWTQLANGVTAVVPDGVGGAYIAGSEGSTERGWFLRRVGLVTNVLNNVTNVVVTNFWTQRLYGPGAQEIQINPQPYRANVKGLRAVADGLVVAGQFSVGARFGAVVVTNGALPIFNLMGGGVVLTNTVNNPGADVADLYVAKYAFDGRLLWARSYGNTNAEALSAFAADAAGNVYLGGAFQGAWTAGAASATSRSSTNSGTVTVMSDAFVLKLDPNGEPAWIQPVAGQPRFPGVFTSSRVNSLAVAPDGRVYYSVARAEEIPASLRPGLVLQPRSIGSLRPTGEPAWTRDLRTRAAGTVNGTHLAADAEGNLLLAETTPAFLQAGQRMVIAEADVAALPNAGVQSGTAVAKFSPLGELLWLRALDSKVSYADESRAATPSWIGFDPAGSIVVAGQLPSRLGSGSASPRGSGQRFDAFELVRTNLDSNDAFDLFIARLAPVYRPTAPSLVASPLSATPDLGTALLLSGQADGFPAPSYQWRLNGQPIPGATTRYLSVDRLSRTNRGVYELVASNAFGVAVSASAAVQPQLPSNMRGWRYVTSVTNFLGEARNVGLDDAGRLYVLHNGTAQGDTQWLERWNPDGSVAWRFQQFPATGSGPGYLLHRRSPVVTPDGAVLVFGRSTSGNVSFNTPNGGFVARLNPDDGTPLWVRSFTWTNGNPALPVALAVQGAEVRALFSGPAGSFVHRTALDGTALPASGLTGLPAGARFPDGMDGNSATALAADGSLALWANRAVTVNNGLTNFPSQNTTAMVLTRYAADGTPQWFRLYGQSSAVVDPTAVSFDADGNTVLGFDLAGNAPLTYTFGTNVFNGWGGLAKVTPSGDVLWAKAWGLHVRDFKVSADGSTTFAGPVRRDYNAGPTDRTIRFGTNVVSVFERNDVVVGRVDAAGHEVFLRQAGAESFQTIDNARHYYVAVNGRGSVAVGGFAIVPQAGGSLEFGDSVFRVPALAPYNFANLFGDLSVFIAAVLDPFPGPTEPPVVRFVPPTPGSTTFRLDWPAGHVLQRMTSLGANDWSTLHVTPPYEVNPNEAATAFFRVVPAQ